MNFNNIPKEEQALYKAVEKITKPIFDKVLKEIKPNELLVGRSDTETPSFSYIQLHNYRRYFDYNKQTYQPPTQPLKIKKVGYRKINYGKEEFFNNFLGCSIRIKKETIQITNKIEHKNWRSIDNYKAHDSIKEIIKSKEIETLGVLKAFIDEFKGKSKFNLVSHDQEIKIENNPITDKLTEHQTWYKKEHKKVYKKKLIEVPDIDKAIKLIDNSVLYDNIPEIADPLRVLATGMKQLLPMPSVQELKEKIKKVEDVNKYQSYFAKLRENEAFEMMKHIKPILYN